MAKCEYLECGRIHNTHGCHGWVKAESYCDTPEVLAGLPCVYRRVAGAYVPLRILDTGRKQQTVLLRLEGVDDMNAAELLKGEVLYAARADIPMDEGAYFLADLVGLPVIDAESGKEYGKVKEINFSGPQDILVIQTSGGDRLFPMVDAFMDHVDVDGGVFVRPIPGLLED